MLAPAALTSNKANIHDDYPPTFHPLSPFLYLSNRSASVDAHSSDVIGPLKFNTFIYSWTPDNPYFVTIKYSIPILNALQLIYSELKNIRRTAFCKLPKILFTSMPAFRHFVLRIWEDARLMVLECFIDILGLVWITCKKKRKNRKQSEWHTVDVDGFSVIHSSARIGNVKSCGLFMPIGLNSIIWIYYICVWWYLC